jgi:uncharacterized protein YecT (DUF1311 family)
MALSWLALMAAGVAVATPAQAAAGSPRADFRACVDKSDGTDPARNACYTDAARKLLDTTFGKARLAAKNFDAGFNPPVSPPMAMVLEQQQDAWENWLASACDFFGNTAQWGSDGRYLHGPNCQIQMIEDRVDQLNELIALMKD